MEVQDAAEKIDGFKSRNIENRKVFLPHPVLTWNNLHWYELNLSLFLLRSIT
jgi:hypothetical protein